MVFVCIILAAILLIGFGIRSFILKGKRKQNSVQHHEEVLQHEEVQTQAYQAPNRPLRKMAILWTKPVDVQHCSDCGEHLKDEFVQIATYPAANVREAGRIQYIEEQVFTCKSCRYVCADERMIARMQKKAKGYWIDVQSWERLGARTQRPTQQLNQKTSQEEKPFKWPSTFGVETVKPVSIADGFQKESELHKLGYRISRNLSRHRRWQILENEALPKLGLEKVAHTIALNTRQRKHQRGGARKYAYAIKEWEHDLSELKKHYYRWDFIWPHTS